MATDNYYRASNTYYGNPLPGTNNNPLPPPSSTPINNPYMINNNMTNNNNNNNNPSNEQLYPNMQPQSGLTNRGGVFQPPPPTTAYPQAMPADNSYGNNLGPTTPNNAMYSQPMMGGGSYPSVSPSSISGINNNNNNNNNNALNNPLFFNNQMAAMGMQMTQSLVNERMSGLLSWININSLKYYFAVSNNYVLSKIKILLFPFLHKNWKRERIDTVANGAVNLNGIGGVDGSGATIMVTGRYGSSFAIPRDDYNAPDLYIPTMAFVTYVLLLSIAMAIGESNNINMNNNNNNNGYINNNYSNNNNNNNNNFHPDIIGMIASSTLVGLLLETLLLRSAFYFFGNTNYSPWIFDLVAYSSYKYVNAIIIIFLHLLFGSSFLSYISLLLFGISASIFMMRTLSRAMTPGMEGIAISLQMGMNIENENISKRKYFIFGIGIIQIIIVYFLTRQALR